MSLYLVHPSISPLHLLRKSIEVELAKARLDAEREFAVADAFQAAADEHIAIAGMMQARVDKITKRLEES